jgi:hypothetical protein
MSTGRRLIDWRIEPSETSDSYVLHRRNRPVLTDRGMPEIWKYLREHRAEGETVFMRQDPQDVPVNVTRKLDRRHGQLANPRRIRLAIFPFRR